MRPVFHRVESLVPSAISSIGHCKCLGVPFASTIAPRLAYSDIVGTLSAWTWSVLADLKGPPSDIIPHGHVAVRHLTQIVAEATVVFILDLPS